VVHCPVCSKVPRAPAPVWLACPCGILQVDRTGRPGPMWSLGHHAAQVPVVFSRNDGASVRTGDLAEEVDEAFVAEVSAALAVRSVLGS